MWDYSTHRSDCERWQAKVLREEPNADTEIIETTTNDENEHVNVGMKVDKYHHA